MAKLAIKGGIPIAPGGLKIQWPVFDEREEKLLLEILHSGRWFRGMYQDQAQSKVGQAEMEFAKFLGVKYGVAVTNGTTAIELALKAGGIEAGGEVIVPAVSFVASATAIVLVNAIPVFVDVDPDTYQISPDVIEAAITDRTKAIVVVHYGGYPADMDRIMEIAKKYRLLIVEDSAEAHGSEWKGQKVGTIGDMGTFSFQMGKPLTCGEGGIVTTNNKDLAAKCYAYHNLGRHPGAPLYEHSVVAWNYRMTEFQGAILLGQMTRLREQTETRHQNGEYFAQELEKIGGVRPLKRDPRVTKRGYYFYFIRYNSNEFGGLPRLKFKQALEAEGIGTHAAHNQPLYKNEVFMEMHFGRTGCPIKCPLYGKEVDYSKVHCPQAERIYTEEVVSLSKDFLMYRENIDLIIAAIRKIKENSTEL